MWKKPGSEDSTLHISPLASILGKAACLSERQSHRCRVLSTKGEILGCWVLSWGSTVPVLLLHDQNLPRNTLQKVCFSAYQLYLKRPMPNNKYFHCISIDLQTPSLQTPDPHILYTSGLCSVQSGSKLAGHHTAKIFNNRCQCGDSQLHSLMSS